MIDDAADRNTGSSEGTAIKALGWIASDSDMLNRFLALTGIEAGQIRQAAAEPGFLAGVLDFLLAHEPSLMAFCADRGISPETVQNARQRLGTGADNAWLST